MTADCKQRTDDVCRETDTARELTPMLVESVTALADDYLGTTVPRDDD